MFRTILIVMATLLAGGGALLGRQIPVRVDMKHWAQVLIGLGLFFLLFFSVVRFIDDYVWWTVPTVAFTAVIYWAVRRLSDIDRLIRRQAVDEWLVEVTATAATTKEKTVRDYETLDEVLDFDDLDERDPDFDFDFGEVVESDDRPRRFLDDFVVADEANLPPAGPTDVELEHLDEFVFTARHAYLIHDRGLDAAGCDVMTIEPGMSIADLIDAAKLHVCKEQ